MKTFYKKLYFWVLLFILLGGVYGAVDPEQAVKLKVFGDAFIALIKMVIAPLIFCSVALGIAGSQNLGRAGRVGAKALLYFEVVSTFALAIGLLVANVFKPGASFNVDPKTLDPSVVSEYTQKAHESGLLGFFLHLIPKTFFEPLASNGDILQVLLVAILFGAAVLKLTPAHQDLIRSGLEALREVFFVIIKKIMWLAPIGSGCAMAFTISKYGVGSLKPLLYLMACFYLTCILFVFIVLGLVARYVGFSITRYLRYVGEEILLILGTSSSETAFPPLMKKLENLGASKSVVGLVLPTGYSFNLDGTNIYLTLACLFVAQALNVPLTLTQELSILLVAMVSSKGASGVTGSGFITLAATLSIVPDVPVAGLALILGVDRFMSEARAITNMIGNGVATLAVAKWEGELDTVKLRKELGQNPV